VATQETPLEVRAEAKWVRISPRKARLVAEHIRGRSVPEARSVLAFTPREAARELDKVLRSAVANAESQHQLSDERLYVSSAYVNEGPRMKRWRARARGRVSSIKKRTCHITVTLAEIPVQEAPAPKKRAAAKKTTTTTKQTATKQTTTKQDEEATE
jgi:large subunit ribosomal protein L22